MCCRLAADLSELLSVDIPKAALHDVKLLARAPRGDADDDDYLQAASQLSLSRGFSQIDSVEESTDEPRACSTDEMPSQTAETYFRAVRAWLVLEAKPPIAADRVGSAREAIEALWTDEEARTLGALAAAVRRGAELPETLSRTDEDRLRDHVSAGSLGPTPLRAALVKAGINAEHADEQAEALEGLSRSTGEEMDHVRSAEELARVFARTCPEHASNEELIRALPGDKGFWSSTDAAWLRRRIAFAPMHPIEWRGSARLRVELSKKRLIATARGDTQLLPKLLAVVRLHVHQLIQKFPGLQLEVSKPTEEEAIGALLLAVAKKSTSLPPEVLAALPADSLWTMDALQVQAWCKTAHSRRGKGTQKLLCKRKGMPYHGLRFSGRGLLALDVSSKHTLEYQLLKLAGMPVVTLLTLWEGDDGLDRTGWSFWDLATRQLVEKLEGPLLAYGFVRVLGSGAFGDVYHVVRKDGGSIAIVSNSSGGGGGARATRDLALKNQRPPSLTELIKLEKGAEIILHGQP